MLKVRANLRKVAAIAACLAGITVFSGCEKDPTDDEENVDGIDMSDNEYYGTQQNDLEKTLRNVHFKYWYQIPDLDPPNNEKLFGEVMSCKGRLWGKGDRWATSIKNVEKWYGYSKEKYWAYCFNLHEKIEWLGNMGFQPPFETMRDGLMGEEPRMAIEKYFGFSQTPRWNQEVVTETQAGITLTSTLTKYDEITVIAGRNCKSYSIYNKQMVYDIPVGEGEEIRVWYDPETKVTMKAEGKISNIVYKFEITEIDYGKVTIGQIDKKLEDYLLQYPNNTDISNQQDAGAGW